MRGEAELQAGPRAGAGGVGRQQRGRGGAGSECRQGRCRCRRQLAQAGREFSRKPEPCRKASSARQGARAMPFCPSASNTRASPLALWHAGRLCSSTTTCQPARPSPALWAARDTETARGRVWHQRSWHRYGRGYPVVRLCPGTSRILGWLAPTRRARCPCASCRRMAADGDRDGVPSPAQ